MSNSSSSTWRARWPSLVLAAVFGGFAWSTLSSSIAVAKDEQPVGNALNPAAGPESQALLQGQMTALAKLLGASDVSRLAEGLKANPVAGAEALAAWFATRENLSAAGMDPRMEFRVQVSSSDGSLLAKKTAAGQAVDSSAKAKPPPKDLPHPNPMLPPCWRVSVGYFLYPNGPGSPGVWVETGWYLTPGCPPGPGKNPHLWDTK